MMAASATPNKECSVATVARVTEISAKSEQSFEDAIQAGISRANQSLRNVRSAWVKEQRLEIDAGRIVAHQVNLLVTFELDE